MMQTKTALAAAGALALTVTGGVSALFLTVERAGAGNEPAATIVEYVDETGAPLLVEPVPVPGDADDAVGVEAYEEGEGYEDHDDD